jgi:hypothetical protein
LNVAGDAVTLKVNLTGVDADAGTCLAGTGAEGCRRATGVTDAAGMDDCDRVTAMPGTLVTTGAISGPRVDDMATRNTRNTRKRFEIRIMKFAPGVTKIMKFRNTVLTASHTDPILAIATSDLLFTRTLLGISLFLLFVHRCVWNV